MATADARKRRVNAGVSGEFVRFADTLTPPYHFVAKGKASLQNVFLKLQKDPRFSVDRPLFAGSLGKKTSLQDPDFDGVVFLNGRQPPLETTVGEFEEFLRTHADSLGIKPGSIQRYSLAVNVRFYNGIEMDLLPACNFSQNVDKQCEEVFRRIRENPRNYLSYSSSLADIQVEFLKQQDGPTHQLIRLIKYWFKKMVAKKVYGGSYLMEILGVAVSHETENLQINMFGRFKIALKKIQNIESQRIAFLRDGGVWKLLSERELSLHRNIFGSNITTRRSFIIDPSNPWNDMMEYLNQSESVGKLKECATLMLERLERLESIESNEMMTIYDTPVVTVSLDFEKIFEPIGSGWGCCIQ